MSQVRAILALPSVITCSQTLLSVGKDLLPRSHTATQDNQNLQVDRHKHTLQPEKA